MSTLWQRLVAVLFPEWFGVDPLLVHARECTCMRGSLADDIDEAA